MEAHCLLNWSLCDICSCPPASAQRKKWEVYEDKIKQPQIYNLEQFILNLWEKLESTDKYFQTETNCLLMTTTLPGNERRPGNERL